MAKKSEQTIKKELADKLTSIAVRQFEVGNKFKQKRMEETNDNISMYNNERKKSLKGRFNVPLPVMSGFVETLLAKVDDPPKLTFAHTNEADLLRAKKTTAAWEQDSASVKGMWGMKDLLGKKIGIFCGRTVYKYFAESNPKYHSNLEIIDPMDFICEPMGGWHLENHAFMGQTNLFKTKYELDAGVKDGVYSAEQVRKLTFAQEGDGQKNSEDAFLNKVKRFEAYGLDIETHKYVGESYFNLTEWYMTYEGTRYYILFDYKTGTWIRFEKLNDVFKSDLFPMVSWATHPDEKVFWSRASADDVRPTGEAVRVIFNQLLDNIQKRNWGQRAYDSDIFPDPSRLDWRPDGLVPVKALAKGTNIQNGIYEFQTPDNIQIGLKLVDFVNSYIGQKTGVTPDTQGESDEKRVGIYFGNMQQVADRLGLLNKWYAYAWTELGQRYYYGLKEHAKEGQMVKMIGEKGVYWDSLRRDDLKPIDDFDIKIISSSAEQQTDELEKKRRYDGLTAITTNQSLLQKVSPNWAVQEILKYSGYDDEQVRVALDTKNEFNQEVMAHAALGIEDIINGKQPKVYRGATTAFLQKILDYAYDSIEDEEIFTALMAYLEQHIPIAMSNTAREMAVSGVGIDPQQQPVGRTGQPTEITPAEGIGGEMSLATGGQETRQAAYNPRI